MPRPIPDDKRDAILNDIKAGKPRNVIARDHQVSPSTVTKVARENDLTFDRSQTKDATAAVVADTANRRAALAERLIALAESSMDQALAVLAEASARDAAVVLGIAVDKHIAIERHNTGADAEQAGSLLGTLFDNLRAKHGDTPTE